MPSHRSCLKIPAKDFGEVAALHGAALKRSFLGRGLAVGDIDNDGDSDLLLLNAGEPPVLLRNDGETRTIAGGQAGRREKQS